MKCFLPRSLTSFGVLASLLMVCIYGADAQTLNNGKILAKIIDSANKTPVGFATVAIYKVGSTVPVNGVTTDNHGDFKIEGLVYGRYDLAIELLGYHRKIVRDVALSNTVPSIRLNTILLSQSSRILRTVSVVAKAPVVENKIDKMVYNAANDLTAQGGVALDILKKVPQVTVGIDGTVELQGNPNVKFLINGKPSSIFGASLADALQSIPASQIKSIEVLTNPGAKYEASGTGGIINIILKDNKSQGENGSVNLSAGTRLENGSFNFNVKKDRVGFSVFFSGNEQLNTTTLNTNHRTAHSGDSTTTLQQIGSGTFRRSGYQTGINFQWDITAKDNLIASVDFDHFGNRNRSFLNQEQQTVRAPDSLLSDIKSSIHSNSRFVENTTDWSLSYKRTFKENQELNVLYTFSNGINRSSYGQTQQYFTSGFQPSGSVGDNPGKDRETDISIDYSYPFAKAFAMETGGKVIFETLHNAVKTDTLLTNNAYVFNDKQSFGFNYSRKIYAYYLSINFSLFHNFLEGKTGARYEYTETSADFPGTRIPSYGIFAPTLLFSHKLNDKQSVKVSYSYRIERPDYDALNPFFNIADPHNISTGDPRLRVEIGHNYELGYNRSFMKGGNLYLAGIVRYNTNDIQPLNFYYSTLTIDGTTYSNVNLRRQANLGTETSSGLSFFGSLPVTEKLNLRANIFSFYRVNKTPGLATVSGFTYRTNLNISYEFNKDFVAEAFGNFNSSLRTITGTRAPYTFYNLAVRKQFWHKKASIGLTAANPFNQYIRQKSTTFGSNFFQDNLREVPLRSFGITLSYKFGKLEFKEKPQEDAQPSLPSDTK